MKYCAKCGNSMEDDMMFCQKCGTRFENTINDENSIDDKIEQIKKYNLVIESSSLSWQYIHEDGERAGNLIAKQNNMCQELCKLIRDVLDNLTDKNRDIVEREVYSHILSMGCKMCKEGEKLFGNYDGYKELFEQGNSLVIAGCLEPGQFLNKMMDVDRAYKVTAGVQGLNACELKKELNENVIYENLEFRKLTKDLAQTFNKMWSKCIKRHTDFFLSPSADFININWSVYEAILKGLSQSIIDTLDESGWDFALDDREKNHNDRQFKEEFNRNRNKKRGERRKQEQEEADKKYWEKHSEEYKVVQENIKNIANLKSAVSSVENEITALKKQREPYEKQEEEFEYKIYDKKERIDKLNRKIFGKKKAKEEIQILNNEILHLEEDIKRVNISIKEYDEPLSTKGIEKSELQRKIRGMEQEISDLRNK